MACPGWGWQDRAYWISAPPVRFQSAGPQTVRIQTREDGLQIDQIVLSPVTYFSTAPGSPEERRDDAARGRRRP